MIIQEHTNLRDRFLSMIARWYMAQNREKAFARRGYKVAVFANDTIGDAVVLNGYYDFRGLQHLLSVLNCVYEEGLDAYIALDIGANIGNHAGFLGGHFRTVHAFEANPTTFPLLAYNAATLGNIKAHPVGVTDEPTSRMVVRGSPYNNGGSQLVRADVGDERLQLVTLDDYLNIDGEIALVKVDVEGMEPNVIRGAMKTLREHLPVIAFEQNRPAFSDTGRETETISLLRSEGYKIGAFIEGNEGVGRRKLRGVRARLFGARRFTFTLFNTVPPHDWEMLIAVHPERHKKVITPDFELGATHIYG